MDYHPQGNINCACMWVPLHQFLCCVFSLSSEERCFQKILCNPHVCPMMVISLLPDPLGQNADSILFRLCGQMCPWPTPTLSGCPWKTAAWKSPCSPKSQHSLHLTLIFWIYSPPWMLHSERYNLNCIIWFFSIVAYFALIGSHTEECRCVVRIRKLAHFWCFVLILKFSH